jgi:hypothetical protein
MCSSEQEGASIVSPRSESQRELQRLPMGLAACRRHNSLLPSSSRLSFGRPLTHRAYQSLVVPPEHARTAAGSYLACESVEEAMDARPQGDRMTLDLWNGFGLTLAHLSHSGPQWVRTSTSANYTRRSSRTFFASSSASGACARALSTLDPKPTAAPGSTASSTLFTAHRGRPVPTRHVVSATRRSRATLSTACVSAAATARSRRRRVRRIMFHKIICSHTFLSRQVRPTASPCARV